MVKRPWSVALISIVLIVYSVIRVIMYTAVLIKSPITERTPDELPLLFVLLSVMLASVCFLLAGGILSFIGMSLGRWFIIGWGIVALIVQHDYMIPRIIFLIIALLMLFNKPANQFFRSRKMPKSSIMESELNT